MHATYYIEGLFRQPNAERARNYLGIVPGGGAGTVTNTGALTADQVVVGNGGTDIKVLPSPGDATKFLDGGAAPAFDFVRDSDLSTSDIVTNDVSIAKHGFAPKAPNDATKFLNGTGAYSVPAGGAGTVTNTGVLTDHGLIVGNGGVDVSALAVGASNTVLHGVTGADPAFSAVVEADITLADNTTNNVTSLAHGFAPKSVFNSATFLNGANPPSYQQVNDSDLLFFDVISNDSDSTKHGFLRKTSNLTTDYLNGQNNWSALTGETLTMAVSTTNDVTSTKHGFCPQSPVAISQFLRSGPTPGWDAVFDDDLTMTAASTINDVGFAAHGFCPAAPNDITKFLRGDATWAVSTGSGLTAAQVGARTVGSL